MARTSTIVQWGLDCRGVFSRARRKALSSSSAPLERLEDRRLLSVTLVSANTLGQALGSTDQIAISDNGQWVAFATTASAVDLGVTGVTDGAGSLDVFLKNLQSGAVTLVSAIGGAAVGGHSPSPSADRRVVPLPPNSSGLASRAVPDTNGSRKDVYTVDFHGVTDNLPSPAT